MPRLPWSQRRDWITFGIALLVGALLGSLIVWAIRTGHDVVAVIGDALTFVTVVAAVFAVWYAYQSARSAEATVKPMQDMAADLTAAAETLKANLTLAERVRKEDRLVRRVEQYERIHEGLVRLEVAYQPGPEVREGQVVLRVALARFPAQELPTCWKAATLTEGFGAMPGLVKDAHGEIDPLLTKARQELADFLKSEGP